MFVLFDTVDNSTIAASTIATSIIAANTSNDNTLPPYLIAIIAVSAVLVSIIIMCAGCNIYGNCIRARGQRPLDDASMARLRLNGLDPKFAKTDTNPKRNVEYLVYGASNPDPTLPVMINMHGSGFEASIEKSIHHTAAEHFGVKGIAISWVGHGGTDIKVGRQVCEWAAEDLDAVLRAESVGEFFITGHSSGNPHAMVAAWHFGGRCVGLGLNAPCIDDVLCKELNKGGQVVSQSLGQDKMPTQAAMAKCYCGLYWAMMDMMLVRCAPRLSLIAVNTPAPEDRWFKEALAKSCVRSAARGGVGPAG